MPLKAVKRKRISHIFSAGLLSGLLLFSGAVLADAKTELSSLLNSYSTFSAEFDQITVGENGRSAQQSIGQLTLSKPNRFRWQTTEPAPQEIVADGRYLWIYDPDLEQVTRRNLNPESNSTPARILNGEIDSLLENFSLTQSSSSEAEQLFELKSISAQTSFSVIRLVFHEQVLSELMLEDSLGQRTTIVFKSAQRNPELPPEEFEFRIPKDVDLIIDGTE
ncbi:outer membrane lipoprotein chaperone LolA [Neptuniibacter sp. CAU 1671]|uniref:outer membrane lipoprotein chaperone LolA n=1 Tax=Neptuniibacter sp. CAU 1671 TaxID=3032593 RepID=UPI0023D9C061|nr:outer membrane lipoprotein chaperone LolA [Neptuniibacter sp. CAU 1671]MDF2180481.1 outer membrane lipoprotein chaperone LolA [Neptuniibacter sp. CAU 1671]